MSLVHTLHALDRNLIFSGQLFFREQAPAVELDFSTRTIFGVAGIIAVPKHVNIKGEHQYSIAGYESMEDGIILGLDTMGYNMKERAKGKNIGHLLLEPIWRI